MHAILTKWEKLKLYFNILKEKNKNYHANIIVSMLNDETNYLYLTFMLPLIQDFEHMILLFKQHTQIYASSLRILMYFINRSNRKSVLNVWEKSLSCFSKILNYPKIRNPMS